MNFTYVYRYKTRFTLIIISLGHYVLSSTASAIKTFFTLKLKILKVGLYSHLAYYTRIELTKFISDSRTFTQLVICCCPPHVTPTYNWLCTLELLIILMQIFEHVRILWLTQFFVLIIQAKLYVVKNTYEFFHFVHSKTHQQGENIKNIRIVYNILWHKYFWRRWDVPALTLFALCFKLLCFLQVLHFQLITIFALLWKNYLYMHIKLILTN